MWQVGFMEEFQQALSELEQYHLLSPSAVVESLQCLERIAYAAIAAELSWQGLQVLAQWIMDEHWMTAGLPEDYLSLRRAEVLLRLDTMFEGIQVCRWKDEQLMSGGSW